MNVIRTLLLAFLAIALPASAIGEVIPISVVNEADADGFPVLWGETVTVRGVVTVGTGLLASNTDVYIQDDTGGINVLQQIAASPVVAEGDSVRVTGVVSSASGKRTYLRVDTTAEPLARIEVLNSGNPLPDPVVVTPRDLASASGEDYEGIYAVVRGVTLPYPTQWPDEPCDQDQATYIADSDTMCRLWFDSDTDLCGSAPPINTFDVKGVVIPRPRTVTSWRGHGMLPPARPYVLSRGSGSGTAEVDPDWVYSHQIVELAFDFTGEAETLTRVSIAIPDGWSFSGDAVDVVLEGDAFAGAHVVDDSTTADLVTVAGCALIDGSPGELTLESVGTPSGVGSWLFEVATAVAGSDLEAVQVSPEIGVGFLADPGVVLINEVYAYGNDSQDRSEFIELVNMTASAINLSGWILTDMDGSGFCGGVNLWAFPPGSTIGPGEYISIAKDARRSSSQGFYPVFGFYPDYELYDPDYLDIDNANSVNLEVVSPPPDGNMATSREIRLLGGRDGNGTSVVRVPSYEAVFLYSDASLTSLVDAMEYRDPVFWDEDACDMEGLGGPDDAWIPGPPPKHYSLSRYTDSHDTDSSRDDFVLSSEPTPGAVNVPDDSLPPEIDLVSTAGSWYLLVEFTEPVDPEDAVDLGNYEINARLEILDAVLSRDGRTVLLSTDTQEASTAYTLSVSGVADLAGNPMDPAEESFSGHFPESTPISEIQAYDELGLSPLVAQPVEIVGFTTVPPGIYQPGRTSMFVQDQDGWGVNVYQSGLMASPPLEGDLTMASGLVVEYISTSGAGATTEVTGNDLYPIAITVVARGFDPLEPIVVATGDVGDEDIEGVLVQATGVVINLSGFAFYIDDGTNSIQVYQNFTDLDFSVFAVGDNVTVTGAVLQYDQTAPYFAGYELAPRYQSDMVKLDDDYSTSARIQTEAKVLDTGADEPITIQYNATKASNVVVRIFDLKGRAIATLFDGICLGPQESLWDGRDDNGLTVASGVYVCHIQVRERDSGGGSDSAVPIVVGRKLK